jgi:hypothetical protein
MTMRHLRTGAAGLAAAAVLSAAAGPADAGAAHATKLERQVDRVLRHAAPGAKQVAPTRVTWPRDGVTLTLSPTRGARAARFYDCPLRYACLWQDANGLGRRVQFLHYRTYKLAAYGMPAGTRCGATSYFNNQTGGAGAVLRGTRWTYWMFELGNLPRKLNDRARTITLMR